MPPVATPAIRSVVLLVLALSASPAAAQSGLYVSVPNPITTEAVKRIENQIKDARAAERKPAVVIFDFNPTEKDSATPDFGAAYDLAALISGLQEFNTVAFVQRKAAGHTVLPIVACKELTMTGQGELGPVIAAGEPPLDAFKANGYDTVVNRTRPALLAVVRKMYDPNVQLREGEKNKAKWYVDLRFRDDAKKAGIEVTNTRRVENIPDDQTASYKSEVARKLGLSQKTLENRNDLADTYNINPGDLRDDPLAGRPPVAFRYVLRGPIDPGVHEAVNRVIEKVIREKGNLLILQLECGGGDPQTALQAARNLADDLIKHQSGENAIKIIAFIPDQAPDAAAVIAMGCSEIVMSKRTDAGPANGQDGPAEATIGDFEAMLSRPKGPGPAQNIDAWASSLRQLAEAQNYPPLLAEGMVRRELEIVRVRDTKDPSIKKLMTRTDYEAEKGNWEIDGGVVKPKGLLLKLTASEAERLKLAKFTVETRNPEEVYARYGLDPAKVKDATPAWLDRFATFLKIPAVTVILVVIGFTGLILELKVPGTTVPGIVSALCFIMVFWAHTQFSGQLAVLAGLLFLLGLVLVLMEVFVLPGFGAAGIFGILLMLGSLALATANEVPQTAQEWGSFGSRMAQYMFGMIGSLIAAFLLARFLPNIPYANRLMLAPPGELPGAVEEPALPGAALAASLLGAVGTAVTVLRPAGSVRFGDQFIDVVTDGGYIPAGAKVQAIEVEGTRIVVKEV